MKKSIYTFALLLIGAITIMSFTTSKENDEGGFYYCFIKGYYNGDTDDQGFVFSHIEEYKNEPQTHCTGWKEFTEKREDHFTAYCNSYTLIGPFSFGHQAEKSLRDKRKAKKDAGYRTSEWSQAPFSK
jgi:hypothetical protein